MRVLMDVGAHDGETLDVALNPKWGFEKIHCFEPASSRAQLLLKFRDKRVTIHQFGLSNESRNAVLFGSGLLGGSVYQHKDFRDEDALNFVENIRLVRISDWIDANTLSTDEIYLKLNCEGSEVDILEDLISSGIISRIKTTFVHFDIRKVHGQEFRQSLVEERLRLNSISFHTPESLDAKSTAAIVKWLSINLEEICVRRAKTLFYFFGFHLPPYLILRKIILEFGSVSLRNTLIQRFGLHSRKKLAGGLQSSKGFGFILTFFTHISRRFSSRKRH